MATQNGVAFFQLDEVVTTCQRMGNNFEDMTFYSAAVPTYYGGIMTFAWGSDNRALRQLSVEELQQRYENSGIKTRYYNPEVHVGSFALPQYIKDAIS